MGITCAGAYSYTLVILEADIREGQYIWLALVVWMLFTVSANVCMWYCRFNYEGQSYIIRLQMGRSGENRYDGELHSSFPNDYVLIVTR